jgi:hypothetical protein
MHVCQIYENAAVTIAAAFSTNCHISFLEKEYIDRLTVSGADPYDPQQEFAAKKKHT